MAIECNWQRRRIVQRTGGPRHVPQDSRRQMIRPDAIAFFEQADAFQQVL